MPCYFLAKPSPARLGNSFAKIVLFLFTLNSCLVCHSQINPNDFPSKFQTAKTVKHVKISNTEIYLVPPGGYHVADNLPGIMKNEHSLIICHVVFDKASIKTLAELQTFPYDTSEMKINHFQKIKLNDYQGYYMWFTCNNGENAYTLIFGDETMYAMITAVCPSGDPQEESKILQTLKTVFYGQN